MVDARYLAFPSRPPTTELRGSEGFPAAADGGLFARGFVFLTAGDGAGVVARFVAIAAADGVGGSGGRVVGTAGHGGVLRAAGVLAFHAPGGDFQWGRCR
jgi:hypothetical protein